MQRVVIVGGGISGLALAYRFEQLHPLAEITILEQRARVGGVIDTITRDGFRVEAGPNGFLDNKPFVVNLCRELGLTDRLLPASETVVAIAFSCSTANCAGCRAVCCLPHHRRRSWRTKLALVLERFQAARHRSRRRIHRRLCAASFWRGGGGDARRCLCHRHLRRRSASVEPGGIVSAPRGAWNVTTAAHCAAYRCRALKRPATTQ